MAALPKLLGGWAKIAKEPTVGLPFFPLPWHSHRTALVVSVHSAFCEETTFATENSIVVATEHTYDALFAEWQAAAKSLMQTACH